MIYNTIKFIAKFVFFLFFSVHHHGEPPNINYDNGVLLCSNHRHWLDPVIISVYLKNKVHWLAKSELFNSSFKKYLFSAVHAIAVDRQAGDMRSLRVAISSLKEGSVVGIFPEGTRIKYDDISYAKPGVALLAIKSGAKVCPITIRSSYRLFSRIDIYWGEPYIMEKPEGRLNSEAYEMMAKDILSKIYGMGSGDK